jgi:hypothetical protein
VPSEGVTGLWTFDERLASHELRYRDINLLTKRGLMKGWSRGSGSGSGSSSGSGSGSSSGSGSDSKSSGGGSGKRKAGDQKMGGSTQPQEKKIKSNESESEIIAWNGKKKLVTMVDLTEDA